MSETPRELFNRAVSHSGPDCLLWPFALHKNGYPKIKYKGKVQTAHRAVCIIVHGPSPPGHEASHSCGVQSCISGGHLSWKTPVDNAADKIAHGSAPVGEKNGAAKITREQALEIRAAKGKEKQVRLAARYGVTQALISKIQNDHIWKD